MGGEGADGGGTVGQFGRPGEPEPVVILPEQTMR